MVDIGFVTYVGDVRWGVGDGIYRVFLGMACEKEVDHATSSFSFTH